MHESVLAVLYILSQTCRPVLIFALAVLPLSTFFLIGYTKQSDLVPYIVYSRDSKIAQLRSTVLATVYS